MKLSIWFAGTMSDFAGKFENNEALYNQARAFWRTLDGGSLWFILTFFILGIATAAYYYVPYNNSPGRHYRPKYWGWHLTLALIICFILTLVIEHLIAPPKLDGATQLEIQIATVNAFYAVLVYLATSFVWCNFLPTNAYRLLKL